MSFKLNRMPAVAVNVVFISVLLALAGCSSRVQAPHFPQVAKQTVTIKYDQGGTATSQNLSIKLDSASDSSCQISTASIMVGQSAQLTVTNLHDKTGNVECLLDMQQKPNTKEVGLTAGGEDCTATVSEKDGVISSKCNTPGHLVVGAYSATSLTINDAKDDFKIQPDVGAVNYLSVIVAPPSSGGPSCFAPTSSAIPLPAQKIASLLFIGQANMDYTCANQLILHDAGASPQNLSVTATFNCNNNICKMDSSSQADIKSQWGVILNGGAKIVPTLTDSATQTTALNLTVGTLPQFTVNNQLPPLATLTSINAAASYSPDIKMPVQSGPDVCFPVTTEYTIPAGKVVKFPFTNQNSQTCTESIQLGDNTSYVPLTFSVGSVASISGASGFKDWDQHAAGDWAYMINPKCTNSPAAGGIVNPTLTFEKRALPFPLKAVSKKSDNGADAFLNDDPKPPVIPDYAPLESLVDNYLTRSFYVLSVSVPSTVLPCMQYEDIGGQGHWLPVSVWHCKYFDVAKNPNDGDRNGSKTISRLMMVVAGMMKLTLHGDGDPASFKKYTQDYVKILTKILTMTTYLTPDAKPDGGYVLAISNDGHPQSYSLADADIAASLVLASQVCQEATSSVCKSSDPTSMILAQKTGFLNGFIQQDVYTGKAAVGVTTPILTSHNINYLTSPKGPAPTEGGALVPANIHAAYSQTDLAMLHLISASGKDESKLITNTLDIEQTQLGLTGGLPLLANSNYPCTYAYNKGCDYVSDPNKQIGDGGPGKKFNTFNIYIEKKTIDDSAGDVPGLLGSYILTGFKNDSQQDTNVTLANAVLTTEMQRLDNKTFDETAHTYGILQVVGGESSVTTGGNLPSRNAVSFLLGELGLAALEKSQVNSVSSDTMTKITALKQSLNKSAKDSCEPSGDIMDPAWEEERQGCSDVIMLGLYVDGAFNDYNNPLVAYSDIFNWAP